jgi:ATP-dependent Zn protease
MKLFSKHKKEIIALSDRLAEKELLYADEIKSIVGL